MTAVRATGVVVATSNESPRHQPGATAPVSIAIRELKKSFSVRKGFFETVRHPLARERARVLHGITLDIRQGELFGVLGLNGAGKTTLLKILATLLLPDSGEAFVGGHPVADSPQGVREIVSMVSAEERSLNWRLSGLENLRLFAGLHRLTRAEADVRIERALEVVGLSGAGNKLVGAYSSGMRQRLLVSRALIAKPRVLLLDEPTRSLDPVTAHEFRRMLRDEIVDGDGTTVVLATHNSEEAFNYCDRVAVLHHGTVAALGNAADLSARFGEKRYRVWTHNVGHPEFDHIARRGLVTDLVRRLEPDGSATVECLIDGDDDAAAVLRSLVAAGVTVTRFECESLPLSSLIGRIVANHAQSPGAGDA